MIALLLFTEDSTCLIIYMIALIAYVKINIETTDFKSHMFEYIRSPDIYRATSLFAFTVLAYKKTPFGRASCPVR